MSEPRDDDLWSAPAAGELHLAPQKEQMVRSQLRGRRILDRRVLDAMARVPRERFVPEDQRSEAYADKALPIGWGQTISQPYIVALMTEALELTGGQKVLEVGTGSGYQTAILAELAGQVFSVERCPELSAQAEAVLAELGYANATLKVGDGSLGWPDAAPFDRIIVTAAAAECPSALFDQLQEGGILVIPVGRQDYQTLQAIRKIDSRPERTDLAPCRFVPLLGAQGWPE
jgi:protein-L-isoaspartate(D-aspartate) O-methyltransferase